MGVHITTILACDHLAPIIYCQTYANIDDDGLPPGHPTYTIRYQTHTSHPLPSLQSAQAQGFQLHQRYYVHWKIWVWLPIEYSGDSCPWRTTMHRQRSGAPPTQLLSGPILRNLIPSYYSVCTNPFGQCVEAENMTKGDGVHPVVLYG